MSIVVIQPDSGNITSVCDALDRLGRSWTLLRDPDEAVLAEAGQLLLPGQGRFGSLMRYLDEHGWTPVLRRWFADDKPFLGICVGMQVLFERSEEDPDARGLGLLEGDVVALRARKRPMMGWAPVRWLQGGLAGDAYFVNGFVVERSPDALATTENEMTFVSAAGRGAVVGVQFHPEKSGAWGKEWMQQCLVS